MKTREPLEYRRGDVLWIQCDPSVGVEPRKTRTCVVVSNDVANQHGQAVTVVPTQQYTPERAARAYVVLHKPAGVTSTTRDRHAETTVLDLLPTALVPDAARLYPVGRLDLDSEGLLLLTNDGDWADRVLHPRYGVQREYAVGVARSLDHAQARALRDGIRLEEGLATLDAPLRPATAIETRALVGLLWPAPAPDLVWYRAVIAQGWKRQLRRMFGAVEAPIERLVRVRIGAVRLDGLVSGRARLLKAPEVRALGTGVAAAPRPGPSLKPGRRSGRRPRQPERHR